MQISNINTKGCSGTIVELAEFGIKVLCGVTIGITFVLIVNIVLVQYLIILIRKEMAMYNSKKTYNELEESESLSYVT